MKTFLKLLLAGAAVFAVASVGQASLAEIGKPAPDFSLTDLNGNKHSLSEFKGKTVVLEWINPECPFVVKHYGSGNMPKLQASATASGVVWLTINSGHPGAQGDYSPAQAEAWLKKNGAGPTAYLRDQNGEVGKLYDARTTPHMFVIDPSGTLVYAGGIDSIRSANVDDIPKATNYVTEALADVKAGKAVRTPTSRPYGCSVKYD